MYSALYNQPDIWFSRDIMQRKIIQSLEKWKHKANRKPLIIQGARQVGKTWAMKHFGKRYFAKTAYINFDNNPRMKTLFSGDYDIGRLLLGLKIESGVDIQAEDTLLIFDEIQEVPQALSSLKYFYEMHRSFISLPLVRCWACRCTIRYLFPSARWSFYHFTRWIFTNS